MVNSCCWNEFVRVANGAASIVTISTSSLGTGCHQPVSLVAQIDPHLSSLYVHLVLAVRSRNKHDPSNTGLIAKAVHLLLPPHIMSRTRRQTPRPVTTTGQSKDDHQQLHTAE